MSRFLLSFFLISLVLCTLINSGCGSRSLENYYDKGINITLALLEGLENIHNREELIAAAPRLKQLFLSLIKTIIAAREYQEMYPQAEMIELTQNDHIRSERVREQLQRIYRIDGCREIIEKCQQEALNLLDAYQQQLQKRKESSLQLKT